MKIDLNYFRKKLEDEKKKLEDELKTTSIKNPKDSRDWQAVYPEKDLDEKIEPDFLDAAEEIEEYQERYSLNDVLEKRLNNVKDALKAVADGNYGKCTVDGTSHDIEPERLEANPAATTCIAHIE